MIWFVAASLLFGFFGGYLVGLERGESKWESVFGRYLDAMPEETEVQRMIALLARLEVVMAKAAVREAPPAPELLEPEELRERIPKRLREADNRTFWS